MGSGGGKKGEGEGKLVKFSYPDGGELCRRYRKMVRNAGKHFSGGEGGVVRKDQLRLVKGGEGVIVGVDPAAPGADETVVVRRHGNGAVEVVSESEERQLKEWLVLRRLVPALLGVVGRKAADENDRDVADPGVTREEWLAKRRLPSGYLEWLIGAGEVPAWLRRQAGERERFVSYWRERGMSESALPSAEEIERVGEELARGIRGMEAGEQAAMWGKLGIAAGEMPEWLRTAQAAQREMEAGRIASREIRGVKRVAGPAEEGEAEAAGADWPWWVLAVLLVVLLAEWVCGRGR